MTDQTAIEQATRRLTQALDALDAAVERRIEIDRGRTQSLAEQVHALDADRSKLAADLDAQTARSAPARSRQPRHRPPARCRDGEHPARARVAATE